MFLETLPIMPENITETIGQNTSELTKSFFSGVFKALMPVIEILGGILVLYIIYRIILAISDHLMKKRIKRIDENVQKLNKKVDEVLVNLKKNSRKKARL